MYVKENNQGALHELIAGERRAGIDRRALSYDWHIPERRTDADRRQGNLFPRVPRAKHAE